MKILLVINPFKGTMSSEKAAQAAVLAFERILIGSSFRVIPVSDGGDGFIDSFRRINGALEIKLAVTGPISKKVKAEYLLVGREAYIEIAEACGIKHLRHGRLFPLKASTFGVGELIKDALINGAIKVYLGLGGTASSDGGAGMARALGFSLLDTQDRPIPETVNGLLLLEKIMGPKKFPKVGFFAITDVHNPLLGRHGSAETYGPQKGASPAQVRLIEKALKNLSEKLKAFSGKEVAEIPGGGAAGGLGAGLYGFLDARIIDGSTFVSQKLGLKKEVSAADLVITGEGWLDDTTFSGKMPGFICQLAAAEGKKVIFLTWQDRRLKHKKNKNMLTLELCRHFSLSYSVSFPEKAINKLILFNRRKIGRFLAKNSRI